MPLLNAIHTLIDFSTNGQPVFHGTDVPLDKLLQLFDGEDVKKSVDLFQDQYPQVQRIAAYAVLALAGRYPAFALENFLSYSSDRLNDQVWGNHAPNLIDEFKVDWKNLILSAQTVSKDRFRYFAEIYKYGNTMDRVVLGRVFEYSADPEFERLLEHFLKYRVFDNFISTLFSETLICSELREFATTPEALQPLLDAAQFRRVSPFYIEAKLSEYLYRTGIYKRFFKDHSILESQEITRDFLDHALDQRPEERLCLVSHYPWGRWFDQHSCSDFTFIGIHRGSKQIWLFTVSDSD